MRQTISRHRRRLQRALQYGPARRFVGAVYDSVIALELRGQGIADRALEASPGVPLDDITAVVKTFERPHTLRRLLTSVRRFYPELPIVVVDDSREPSHIAGVELVTLPFDSGVSAGRAAGLERVSTEYFVLLDDDFVFHRRTNLEGAQRRMSASPDIDIMGGLVVDLPFYRSHPVQLTAAGGSIDGMPLCTKVPNFYLGRSDRVRLVGWDPLLKRLDHADFFLRAHGVLTTVFNPELRCLHARTLFDDAYMAHRMDFAADSARLMAKHHRPPRGGSGRSGPDV